MDPVNDVQNALDFLFEPNELALEPAMIPLIPLSGLSDLLQYSPMRTTRETKSPMATHPKGKSTFS